MAIGFNFLHYDDRVLYIINFEVCSSSDISSICRLSNFRRVVHSMLSLHLNIRIMYPIVYLNIHALQHWSRVPGLREQSVAA
jgi:hypothetical protein